MIKTTFKEIDNYWVMAFEGRLDTVAAPQVEKEMHLFDNCEGHDIILDCEKLDYISSSGLRLFLSLLKKSKAKGHQVFIRNINDNLKKVFDMTGFTHLFEFIETK